MSSQSEVARANVARAVALLREGRLVAFPTETVYGLGADATNSESLARLYAVKRRPTDHPVIVHLSAQAGLDDWARQISQSARDLAAAFWPGPLTLVLQADAQVSRRATGGLDTVGLRVPSHPMARELLDEFGGGVAAPSANRFGRVSPTTAAAVRSDLGDDVDLVLDGGVCAVGVESTIVDCTGAVARVLRPGAVTIDEISGVIGERPLIGGSTRAPGTLPSHYAPEAVVELATGAELAARAHALVAQGKRVGVIARDADIDTAEMPFQAVTLATIATVEEFAHGLYAALRNADRVGVDVVLAVAPPSAGIGAAVADRLGRAAGGR